MVLKFIEVKIEKNIATITFNRPEIHNAFNDEMILEITSTFKSVSENDDVNFVVLTGNGRSFCAGADLNWMSSMIDYSMEENILDSKKLDLMFKTINECKKPVIGKINGHALGGGMGVLAVCDFVFTHDKAKFGFTETRLGLVPAVISPYCIKKIGESNARAWFISGEKFDGVQAEKMGLVHKVVPLNDFEEASDEIIRSFKAAAPNASIVAKKLVKDIIKISDESETSDYTCKTIATQRVSDEGQDGMKALLNKTKPSWIQE